MPNINELSEKERRALEKIRDLLEKRAETNWDMPDEYAFQKAHAIAQP